MNRTGLSLPSFSLLLLLMVLALAFVGVGGLQGRPMTPASGELQVLSGEPLKINVLGAHYYFQNDRFYQREEINGLVLYREIDPPYGATTRILPAGTMVHYVDGHRIYETLGGAFYIPAMGEKGRVFVQVNAPSGLPETPERAWPLFVRSGRTGMEGPY